MSNLIGNYVYQRYPKLVTLSKILLRPQSQFAIKSGLAAGAVYYLADQGLWKESAESTKLYGKMNVVLSPYLQEVKAQIPMEIPNLPSTDRVSYLMKHYWNKGIAATFTYLGDLPHHMNDWRKKGVEAAMQNPEFKKFIESFSTSAPPPVTSEQKKK